MVDIHPLNSIGRERFLEILQEQNRGVRTRRQRENQARRTHRFPILTHPCLSPTFDPASVGLKFTSHSRVIKEGKTRPQPRSVPKIYKGLTWPAKFCEPIDFLVITRSQPNKSPNVICESSPDEALAEMVRNRRYDLGPSEVRIDDVRKIRGGRGPYIFHEHVIVVLRLRTRVIGPQLSEFFLTSDRGLRF